MNEITRDVKVAMLAGVLTLAGCSAWYHSPAERKAAEENLAKAEASRRQSSQQPTMNRHYDKLVQEQPEEDPKTNRPEEFDALKPHP